MEQCRAIILKYFNDKWLLQLSDCRREAFDWFVRVKCESSDLETNLISAACDLETNAM